jgi:hypothetical protein
MKRTISSLMTWGLIVVLLGLPRTCLGYSGKVTSPSLMYPSDIDAHRKGKIMDALDFMRGKLIFIEGHFFNERTYQRLGGKAGEVVELITRLEELGLWRVDVQFRNFGEQKSAFSLDENSDTMHLRVIVNSGREDFTLRDFQNFLPRPVLPKLRRE